MKFPLQGRHRFCALMIFIQLKIPRSWKHLAAAPWIISHQWGCNCYPTASSSIYIGKLHSSADLSMENRFPSCNTFSLFRYFHHPAIMKIHWKSPAGMLPVKNCENFIKRREVFVRHSCWSEQKSNQIQIKSGEVCSSGETDQNSSVAFIDHRLLLFEILCWSFCRKTSRAKKKLDLWKNGK